MEKIGHKAAKKKKKRTEKKWAKDTIKRRIPSFRIAHFLKRKKNA